MQTCSFPMFVAFDLLLLLLYRGSRFEHFLGLKQWTNHITSTPYTYIQTNIYIKTFAICKSRKEYFINSRKLYYYYNKLPFSTPAINAAPMADISGEGKRIMDLFVISAINCKTKSLFDIPPSVLAFSLMKKEYNPTSI